ncbi:CD109 antigen [Latimeria chalumnae]|uniref:CD109 antigen n=1 Tax=Latimeria chalumnae TaxID=7897 RepID=UPI00313A95BD
MMCLPETIWLLSFFFIFGTCVASPTFLIAAPKHICLGSNTTLSVALFGGEHPEVQVAAEIFNGSTVLANAEDTYRNAFPSCNVKTGQQPDDIGCEVCVEQYKVVKVADNLHMIFVDLTKAFDTASQSSFKKLLSKFGFRYFVLFYAGSVGTLVLPAIFLDTDQVNLQLVVKGYAQNTLLFSNSSSLTLLSKNMSVFIQTDKSLYKAGQGVKIRVVSVNPDLKPYKGQIDIVIMDPKENRIQQWLAVSTNMGVVSKEFQLSENPPLGDWMIQAIINEVLPKFEVILHNSPTYLLSKQENLTGTVTAKYTYGKPVKGYAVVTVSTNMHYLQKINISKRIEINGSADFSFSYLDLITLTPYYNILYSINMKEVKLLLTAVVTESLTGIKRNSSATVSIKEMEYSLQFFGGSQILKPSLNFTVYLNVSRYDNKQLTIEERKNMVTVHINQDPQLMDIIQVRTQSFGNNTDFMQKFKTLNFTYTVPESGIIKIQVPVEAQNNYLSIEAYFQNTLQQHYVSVVFNSPSNTYIQIRDPHSTGKVGSPIEVVIDGTEMIKEINYLVVARGQIVTVGKKSANTFTLTPEQSWMPTARVIVYYVKDSGEVVNDAMTVSTEGLIQNSVLLSWSKNQATPAENISLSVTVREPNSLVGLLVVDKSAKLLGNKNDITSDAVAEELKKYMPENSIVITSPTSVFKKCNLLVLTDADLPVDNSVMYFPEHEILAVQKESSVSVVREPRVRSHFPETWIWIDTNTGSETNKKIDVTVPDSITSWIASAFVISENLGLGLTTEFAQLRAFQAFFVSLNLPYSVTRGEEFILEVTIFNYLKTSLEVMVTLELNGSFDILAGSDDINTIVNQRQESVPSQDGKTVFFPISPQQLGEIPIKVTATSSAANDSVSRKVLVKAEGIEQSYSQTVLLDLAGANPQSVKKTLNFTFPLDVVHGSEKACVTVVGDILGPSITGLESLIQMPYGCGEQNMINFAPNIYVLKYLTATQQMKDDIKQKSLSFMEQGYQRELTYQRSDGSFSAFGNSDSSGSTWLSAFVLRCFLQACPVIYIDKSVLNKTAMWLVDNQKLTGEFGEPGRVIHTELQGGLNGPVTLTAYVLTAFFEDEKLSDKVLAAVNFTEGKLAQGIADNYTLSIVAYALSLAGSSQASTALNELIQRADKQDGTMFWSSPASGLTSGWQPRSTDVELAAYALLSHLKQNRVTEGIPIMKWLSQQRSHLGGYSSTQDTIVALQALSEFESLSASSTVNLMVSVTGSGISVPITLHIGIQQPMSIDITSSGNGLAIFQFNVFYNLKSSVAARKRRDVDNHEAFDLDIIVYDDPKDVNNITLTICLRFLPSENVTKTGMAVMEVDLLSGFAAAEDGIATNDLIKNIEFQENKVVLYFDSLNATEVCVDILAVRESKVAKSKDATVIVYDYYEPKQIGKIRVNKSQGPDSPKGP